MADDSTCPVEPTISWEEAVRKQRASIIDSGISSRDLDFGIKDGLARGGKTSMEDVIRREIVSARSGATRVAHALGRIEQLLKQEAPATPYVAHR